jgi:dolichol-phosphate mannosyltransferase
MNLSVILPTYNESGNIIELIRAIMENVPYEYEIIVVDDNSPDGTFNLVEESFTDNPRIKSTLRMQDRGFAKSIRTGIESSKGERILVMDTDFTHDPEEIPKLLHVSEAYDLVSGSRFCPGGNMQDTKHYLASLFYNWFIRIIIHTQVQDNLGGYFIIWRKRINLLPFEKIFFGYGEYFFRLLHYAQKNKLSIVEIPACYNVRKVGSSKSNFIKMLFTYTSAAIKLKTNL